MTGSPQAALIAIVAVVSLAAWLAMVCFTLTRTDRTWMATRRPSVTAPGWPPTRPARSKSKARSLSMSRCVTYGGWMEMAGGAGEVAAAPGWFGMLRRW